MAEYILNPEVSGTRWTPEVLIADYKNEEDFVKKHMADEFTYRYYEPEVKEKTLRLAWRGAMANLEANGLMPKAVGVPDAESKKK